MRIGTPLTTNAVKVMLLGSGELGKEVVIELQRLGIETIAVDRYANAPAQQVSHRAHVIDMTNAAELRALVETERPHIIVPEIEAIATDELVRIEEAGLATVIPTAKAVTTAMIVTTTTNSIRDAPCCDPTFETLFFKVFIAYRWDKQSETAAYL